ncbi:hypothetical protein [Actinomadura opuntiae]|uniref:hypothetical protein n=1 Tax=Actinomadura sp. OS1-43 TaxID=604315 RepID=UPI00255A84D2|nr:hypothetical protein [Actinomadura sp. OS1-43]MDL4816937.1 hypothetical protein [Actinomadura sp. OS1-43]
MSSILAANAFYRASAHPSILRRPVQDTLGERFALALNALLRELGEDASSPAWEPLVASARAARWRTVTEPVPFASAFSSAAAPLGRLLELASQLGGSLDPYLRALLEELAAAGSDYRQGDNCVLSSAFLDLCSSGRSGSSCVVVARELMIGRISGWLEQEGQRVPVLAPREFTTSPEVWDRAIVLGAGVWFPPRMMVTPRADRIILVHPRWVRDSRRFQGIFGELATRGLSVSVEEAPTPSATSPVPVQLPAAGMAPQLDWSLLKASAPDHASGGHPTEARLAILGGGHAVWLPVTAQRIRGLRPSAPAGERVVNLGMEEVRPGAILLLRFGGTDASALRPLVDSLLGQKRSGIRDLEEGWKSRLRHAIATHGISGLERKVRDRGAAVTNVPYWASDECLRPKNDGDFRALLEVIGLEPTAPYLDAGRALWRAHNAAGRQLAQALERYVEGQDLADLEIRGMQELKLEEVPGVAAMVAFRVIAISPDTATVPSHMARRPFLARGAAWLE